MARRKAPTNPDERKAVRVLRLRLKDKHARVLREMASAVNLVWNYCNELSTKILEREGRFVGANELQRYLNGASREGLAVGSAVFQQVAEEYATRRRQFKKRQLRWRVSNPKRANYSLGWIPFKARSLSYKAGQVTFQGLKLSLWDSYGLANYELGAGSISEDARGRWYLNVTVKVKKRPKPEAAALADALGIDLGLKQFLTTSDGEVVEAQRFYRDLEPKLAVAQRARKKLRVKALHAKIANRRKDFLHQLSTRLVREYQAIFVGDVNASALAQTRQAKSVLDAGWSAFRTMLQYKCDDAGRWFKEVSEIYSTQDCSACGARTGPKGREELHVRRWTCSACKAEHDRDVNAAVNIRQRGLAWLEKEFATAAKAKAPAVVNKDSGALCAVAAAGHGRPVVGIPVL